VTNEKHDNSPYSASLVLMLTNPTNALVLQTQRKSGKCDYWCCLFHHQSWWIVMLAAPALIDR
jgi:hypothetical protein